jgi:hypothetical protein
MRRRILPLRLAALFVSTGFAQTITVVPAGAASRGSTPASTIWSLANSAKRVHELAPESSAAEAEIEALAA